MARIRPDAFAPFPIAAFPLLPLLDISRVYHADWANHGWLMDYYGHYLAAHHWFPRVVNTQQIVGLATPLFYGHFMYAAGGIVSSVLGGDLGIRAVVTLVLLFQCFSVRNTVLVAGGSRSAANIVAALVCWTIYPLTNLYNRGAVTEFFAVGALTCAVCFLLNLTLTIERKINWLWIAGLAFSYSLATVHPITALYGGVFLALIWLVAILFPERRRALLVATACCAPVWTVILAPQVYMLAIWGPSLRIALSSASTNLRFLPSDFALSRLAPFPFDISSLRSGANLETAYLDTQLNFPLLVLALAGMLSAVRSAGNRNARAALALAWFGWAALVLCFLLSTFPALARLFSAAVNRFQYAYRLVSYQDLALLVIAICLIHVHHQRGIVPRRWIVPLCAAAIAIAFFATVEKWTHASASPRPSPIGHSAQKALTLPGTFYADDDYTTNFPGAVSPFPPRAIAFQVAEGQRFGETENASISASGPVLLTTNVSAFPLNRIRIDGTALPWESVQRTGVTFALAIPAGTHTLESRFEPGATWLILRAMSEGVFLALALLFLALLAFGHPQPAETQAQRK